MDIRSDDLDAAVEAGILDAASRERLLAFTRARASGGAGPNNESVRFLTGFNDIASTISLSRWPACLRLVRLVLPSAL